MEENQDLKVRRGQMKGKERFWVRRFCRLCPTWFFGGGGEEGHGDRAVDNTTDDIGNMLCWGSNSVPIFSCVGSPSLQECRHLFPRDHKSLTLRALNNTWLGSVCCIHISSY